jgi:hypothetical protein
MISSDSGNKSDPRLLSANRSERYFPKEWGRYVDWDGGGHFNGDSRLNSHSVFECMWFSWSEINLSLPFRRFHTKNLKILSLSTVFSFSAIEISSEYSCARSWLVAKPHRFTQFFWVWKERKDFFHQQQINSSREVQNITDQCNGHFYDPKNKYPIDFPPMINLKSSKFRGMIAWVIGSPFNLRSRDWTQKKSQLPHDYPRIRATNKRFPEFRSLHANCHSIYSFTTPWNSRNDRKFVLKIWPRLPPFR